MNEQIYHIGVMLGNIYTHHPMELIEGIYAAAGEENVNVTLFLGAQGNAINIIPGHASSRLNYDYHFNTLYDYSLISDLDVLIISYGTLCIYLEENDKESFFNKFRRVPLVILEEYDEKSSDSFIMSDNYNSMRQIVNHLIKVHHYKKILHLSGPVNNMDANERRNAYLYEMKAHNLTVTDEMIEYGDYSHNVEYLVEKLLDNNPDAEAIVCANDEMATSAYNVCIGRGIEIGKDIAITGYDDIELAERMTPPLTTAKQDGLDMGYRALKLALSVCKTGVSKKYKLPAHFIQRASCGCDLCISNDANLMIESIKLTKDSKDAGNIIAAAFCASTTSMRSISSFEAVECCKNYYIDLITDLFKICEGYYNLDNKSDIYKYLIQSLQNIFESKESDCINKTKFSRCIHKLIDYFLEIANSKTSILLLYYVAGTIDAFLQSHILKIDAEEKNNLKRKNWTVPARIQQLMENVGNERYFYELAMEHVKSQGAKSAFIYLLKEPMFYSTEKEFTCPDKLYLAAEFVSDKIVSYAPDRRPVITRENGISSRYPEGHGHNYVAFILFVREYQYGLMLCEIDSKYVSDLYGIGLQLSTAGAFLQMSKKEAETKQHLYNTLKTLEDKNTILSFVSENDQLTNLYNRRGFMENAISITRNNAGKKGCMFFSDLDHLKELNDVFGHTEGDYALVKASEILKKVFGNVGITGRIGGDEFVSLVVSDDENIADTILANLKKETTLLNECSGKPFYVEFSTGHYSFTCSKNTQIFEIIDHADSVLYEAKKNRRPSISRVIDK